jgi:hypothetical protein
MKNEMDALKMDERQRLCWLLANRITLIAVGILWMGLIFLQYSHNLSLSFLVAMVPVIGLFRLGSYLYYMRSSKTSLFNR